MIFDDVLKTRRSIRRFSEKELAATDISAIIDAARISPSAKNRQPWYFSVLIQETKQRFVDDYFFLLSDESKNEYKETGEIMQSAPVLIAVYATEQARTDLLSVGGAIYAMCLKATDLGLGSLWIGDTDIMNSSKEYEMLVGAVAVGYAEESPPQRSRKTIEEISNLTFTSKIDKTEDMIAEADLSQTNFVFISYSHTNREVVVSDILEMKHHGIPLWYDKELAREIGNKWDTVPVEMIRKDKCKVFVLYASYNSLKSKSVLEEFIEATKNRNLKILPVLIGKQTITEIISRLRENGFSENADIYEKFFGTDEKMLYISRSALPKVIDHFQHLLLAFFKNGISREYEAYDHFSYRIEENGCIITGYTGTGNTLNIPECISGYPVKAIEESAFSKDKNPNHQRIERVIFPNTLKRIGLGAFTGTGIKKVEVPFSVVEVQTACFRDCIQLEEATLPDGITYLSEALFRGCERLKRFVAPKTVFKIEEAVFRNCSSLEEVVLPDSLQSMTEGGFYGCRSLKRLIIPCTVVGAEIQSFDTCPLLDRVQIGEFVFEHGTARKV